jgi:hypothetical protein
MKSKVCNLCNKEKTLSEFKKGVGYKGGYRPQCMECSRDYNNKMHHKHKHKRPYDYKRDKDLKLKRAYGISYQEYLHMLDAQDNKCAICGTTDTGKRKAFAVDHCHTCGEVRGLLCAQCNTAIGSLREDLNIIQRAMDYVKFHQEK